MLFTYDHLRFMYEPFPIGLAKPIMEPAVYKELVANFPPLEKFENYDAMGKPGKKYTLSEKENHRAYRAFIDSVPIWRDFYRWIKSDDFVFGIMDMLRSHDIDLGYDVISPRRRLWKMLKGYVGGRSTYELGRLRARFEFSALPVDGGHVIPHTDTPTKIVTLVVSMLREGEWQTSFGGGTDVNRPKTDRLRYNQMNRLAGFDDMEVLHTFDYTPNQAVIFVKTYNSWHSVRPMTGSGHRDLRKTLTIVIERR
jgi:hypothetical protein